MMTSKYFVVFDLHEAHVYHRGADGCVDYSNPVKWPDWFPCFLTSRFLNAHNIPWTIAP